MEDVEEREAVATAEADKSLMAVEESIILLEAKVSVMAIH
jgi:hypothetical protein